MTQVDIFSDAAWISKKKLSPTEYSRIKDELYIPVNEFGAGTRVEPCFVETPEYLGVPRAWAKQNLDCATSCTDFQLVDATKEWPEVYFPPGKGYWSGQLEAIEQAVENFATKNDGFFHAKAGSGKTLMGLSVASKLEQRTLIVVNKEDLAHQWINSLETFFPGATFGHVQQDVEEWDDRHITTATAQTVYHRFTQNKLADFFSNFGFVILDEGHRFSSRTFSICVGAFSAKYRMPMSATFRRRDGRLPLLEYHMREFDVWCKSTHLTGKYRVVGYGKQHPKKTTTEKAHIYRHRVIKAYTEDVGLIDKVSTIAEEAVKEGRKVLVVSDRVQHLKYLEARLKVPISKYYGRYTHDEGDVVLATYAKVAEGTDIPRLDTVILATPKADLEQVVGRIQREHPDKKEPLVYVVQLAGAPQVTSQLKKLGFTKHE